jgi:hypothetical protein
VLNVGAGSGAYEPRDRVVTAVEPSAVMRAQRPPGTAPCLDAVAESGAWARRNADLLERDELDLGYRVYVAG